MGGVVPAAGSALACTCGSVADGTAGIVWGADVAPWEASGAAGGAGAGLGSGAHGIGECGLGDGGSGGGVEGMGQRLERQLALLRALHHEDVRR